MSRRPKRVDQLDQKKFVLFVVRATHTRRDAHSRKGIIDSLLELIITKPIIYYPNILQKKKLVQKLSQKRRKIILSLRCHCWVLCVCLVWRCVQQSFDSSWAKSRNGYVWSAPNIDLACLRTFCALAEKLHLTTQINHKVEMDHPSTRSHNFASLVTFLK